MDVGNGNASAPINLTELLEKIKQEQDLLTARVTQLDEVKSELESKVEVEKETKRKLEEELNTIPHVQVCRESCCHAQMSLYLYKHECRRKPLICFEQVSLNGIIINSCSSSSSFTSASSSSSMTIVSSSSLSSICKQ